MPRAPKNPSVAVDPVTDYRHPEAKRKNIPPAGLAAQGRVRETPRQRYEYNPHRPPILRFDPHGAPDRLPELLEIAQERPLTAEEARLLADALRNHEPWLEWSGKREAKACEVDPVALHIHERVSAQAILRVAARQDVPRTLFADPEQEYREAVQFYQHDVEWSNRLILGDSLAVMASLARREDLAAKVQMIYMDPPYGISYRSNFQSELGKRDLRDRPENLNREPEVVRAYRDTWNLGVHSYLAYLRDRFHAAWVLLADSGSICVQIGDENVHLVRNALEEVFGRANFVSVIQFAKTSSASSDRLPGVVDYVLWYGKNVDQLKSRSLYRTKIPGEEGASKYDYVQLPNGLRRLLTADEKQNTSVLPPAAEIFTDDQLTSQKPPGSDPFPFQDDVFSPSPGFWKTGLDGLRRLAKADRVLRAGKNVRYVRHLSDFSAYGLNNLWGDVGSVQSRTDPKVYVVQTATSVVQRCILMTTDPGDLVLDPTCGSGTTAYVSEQWGRRWIAIDTSRVAVTIARQRMLTAKFDYYQLRSVAADDHRRNPTGTWLAKSDGQIDGTGTFRCKTVQHVTLKSIAQNQALDPIFAKWEPILAEKLEYLNLALTEVTPELRRSLQQKLELKRRKRDRSDPVTDADIRRWTLPETEWKEWHVPFDTDPDWPAALQEALTEYRQGWRQKMDEVNACIAARAEQEELVDQPEIDRRILRVSGPFTVEGVMPAEESLDLESPIGGEPESIETFDPTLETPTAGMSPASGNEASDPVNAEAYVDKMIRLLRSDGVRFPDNKVLKFTRLERLTGSLLHAEGAWDAAAASAGHTGNGAGAHDEQSVGVVFGPQYGPVTAKLVEESLRLAYKRGYDVLVVAGFSFDAAADAVIQDDPNPRVRVHRAQIRPDVNMGDLLKDTPSSQLFTVSGLPRTELQEAGNGEYTVEMQGVDIYDPVTNAVRSAGADKVAAWFLDADYDGRTFCITQAFFPDRSAWAKLSRALTGIVDPERFEALSGTVSLPFPLGPHRRVAVKVIDPRGNEVLRVHRLDGGL